MPFWTDFLIEFWCQDLYLCWLHFVDRNTIDFCLIFRPHKFHCWFKLYWLYIFFVHFGLFKTRSIFEYIYDPTWLGFWVQKSRKNTKREISRNINKKYHFLDRFFIDFGSVLGPNLEPCWLPLSVQDGPRGLQDDLKTPPRRSHDRPKQGYPLGPRWFRHHFWTILEATLTLK